MKKLIIRGDPGLRKGGRIEYDGQKYEVFTVARQGDWHGPDRATVNTSYFWPSYSMRPPFRRPGSPRMMSFFIPPGW